MSFASEVVRDAAIGVGITKKPEGLAAIHRPGCAAAIWERAPLPSFQRWVDGLSADRLPSARVLLQPAAVRRAMYELFQGLRLPDCDERAMLVDDVAALADIFSDLMNAPYLRVRLDVISTNACRKFHIDAVRARLVCTYRGTGTQYGISVDGAEPRKVFTVGTSCPILLRGTLWPVTPKSDLLHRSPPIEGTGEARLVLVIDPISDASSETENFVH